MRDANSIGFDLIVAAGGACELQIFGGDSGTDTLCEWGIYSGFCAIVMGNFYYWDRPTSSARATDFCRRKSQLIVEVFRDQGIAGLRKLEGDFAFVLFESGGQLIAGRDPMGGYPLFWAPVSVGVAVSTSLWRLSNLAGTTVIDREFIADFLVAPSQRTEAGGEASVYQMIRRVRPGWIIAVDRRSKRVSNLSQWSWQEEIGECEANSFKDLTEDYRCTLSAAVSERLGNRTLVHVSGGMDSTSVYLLAQEALAHRGARDQLHSFSLVYKQLSTLAGEQRYIDAALGDLDAGGAHRFDADNVLDYDIFRDPPFHEEPYHALWRLGMDQVSIEVAASINAGTILTGIGADDLLEFLPFHIGDLARRFRIVNAWREAVRFGKVYDCNPAALVKPFVIEPIIARWGLGRWYGPALRGVLQDTAQQCVVPPWINDSFARRHDLKGRAVEASRRIYGNGRDTGTSVALYALSAMAGDVARWSLAAPRGIRLVHPFLDRRIIRLGLSARRRFSSELGAKRVLSEAMRGRLPEIVQSRRRKAHFNEVYYRGIRRNLLLLEKMVAQSQDELEVFHKERLLSCLREGAMALTPARTLQRLDFALALVCWQQQVARSQSSAAMPRYRKLFEIADVLRT